MRSNVSFNKQQQQMHHFLKVKKNPYGTMSVKGESVDGSSEAKLV